MMPEQDAQTDGVDPLDQIRAPNEAASTEASAEVLVESASYDIEQQKLALAGKSQELGWLGKVFGSREHAPTNIAGILLIPAFVVLLASVFLEVHTERVLYAILPIVTSLLGYLFGRSK